MGRWLSPDWSAKVVPVPYAKLDNPQSMNLYAYVGNSPLGRLDSDGHGCAMMDFSYCPDNPFSISNMTKSVNGFIERHPIMSYLLDAGAVALAELAPEEERAGARLDGATTAQLSALTRSRAEAMGVTKFTYIGENGVVGRLANGAQISAGFGKLEGSFEVSISHYNGSGFALGKLGKGNRGT